MKRMLLIANMVVLLLSCDRSDHKKTPPTPPETSYIDEDSRQVSNDNETKIDTDELKNGNRATERDTYGNPDADNTRRNIRDRDPNAITPGSQSENELDRTITQNIRKAIIDDASLSVNAKNIKVITINGVVTLRGVVNSSREKAAIAKKAESVAGVKNVNNLLEEKQ